MSSCHLLCLLCSLFVLSLSAPLPEATEEMFNMPGFFTKHESHEEKFIRSDQNKNKELTFDEFLHMELAYVEAKREEFESLDKNHDEIITQDEYEEHYHGVNSKSAALRAEYFGKVFEDFDEDFDMALSEEEMIRVLAERFLVKPRENFPKIFYSFDQDHSGGLDLNEYMKFDSDFPFEQTDAIKMTSHKQEKLPGDKTQNPSTAPRNDEPLPESDVDMDAVAAVMAQSGVRRSSMA